MFKLSCTTAGPSICAHTALSAGFPEACVAGILARMHPRGACSRASDQPRGRLKVTAMSHGYHGYFEFNEERYDFDEGIASWSTPYLTIYGAGDELLLVFAGIPFPKGPLSAVNGMEYRGHRGDSLFSESLIRFYGTNYFFNEGTIRVLAASEEKSLVSVEFELNVNNTETGTYHDVSGAVKCVIGDIPNWSYG